MPRKIAEFYGRAAKTGVPHSYPQKICGFPESLGRLAKLRYVSCLPRPEPVNPVIFHCILPYQTPPRSRVGRPFLAALALVSCLISPAWGQTANKTAPEAGASSPPAAAAVRESATTESKSALEAAILAGNTSAAKEIMDHLPSGSSQIQIGLIAACRAGQRELAAQALAADADPNDAAGPLMLAAARNDGELVDLLISYGALASRFPGALGEAVHHKNTSMVAALLNAGADPNLPDAKGITPLAAVLTAGEIDLARLMFQHGGYPDDFVEPAMARGDTALMNALFQYGLSPERTDSSGNPLLVRATLDGKLEMVKLLLEKGANPKQAGKEGQAAVHFAAVLQNEELLEVLLDGGADPNQPFFHPVKPAFLERVDDESFKKWLQRDSGLTPLMLAASRGDTSMIRILLDKGARRGAQTKGWQRYPVVFACDAEHVPAAQMLLGRNRGPNEPEYRVVITLSKQRATLYKNDEPVRTCRVSTGRKGFATPTGRFVISDKQRDWVSTIYKVSMPFFMRLSCQEFGMHAGVCPGYPASHGCIRMPRADVQAIYSLLKIGDAVTIEE